MQTEISQKTIANSGGYAVVEQGEKLFFVNYGTSWLYIFSFVCALLFVVALVNGIVQMGSNRSLGFGMLIAALVCGLLGMFGLQKIKSSQKLPLEKATIIAVVDQGKNEFVDYQKQVKVPLNSVSFDRSFQAFSSSFAIRAQWQDGSLIVVRSSPFDGGSERLVKALKDKGLMK